MLFICSRYSSGSFYIWSLGSKFFSSLNFLFSITHCSEILIKFLFIISSKTLVKSVCIFKNVV